MSYPHSLMPLPGERARLGLIVLQSDYSIEQDFFRLLPGGDTALHISRVVSAPDVSTETLAQMEQDLPRAASLFPQDAQFDVVGYGCTSGASVIGAQRVAQLVKSGCTTTHVSEPLSALVAATRALGLSRVAFLSPYVADVSDRLRGALATQGIKTPVFGSFEIAEEALVARVDAKSIFDAAVDLGRDSAAEAVFLSCTNLRTLEVIADVERALGKPCLSSNQVLAWHMGQLSGVPVRMEGGGRLLEG